MPVAAVKLQAKILLEKEKTIAELTAKLHETQAALHKKDIDGKGDAGVPGDAPEQEMQHLQEKASLNVSASAADPGHEEIVDIDKRKKVRLTSPSAGSVGNNLQGGGFFPTSFVCRRSDLKEGEQHPFYIGMYYNK